MPPLKLFFDTSVYNSLLKEGKQYLGIIHAAKSDKVIEIFWHPSVLVELLCTFKKHPSVGKDLIDIFYKLAKPLGLHQPSGLIAADFQSLFSHRAKNNVFIDFAYIDKLFNTHDLIKNLSQGIIHNKKDLFRLIDEKANQKKTDSKPSLLHGRSRQLYHFYKETNLNPITHKTARTAQKPPE